MDSMLHIGVGRATITPPVGVDLMGFSRRSQPSTAIHMDMYATALMAAAHGGTVVILDCDLIYLHPPLVDEIRDAIATFLGTQRSHVLINCTHSHSAPTSSPVKIGGEQDRVRPEEEAYIHSLPHLLLSAVKQAKAAMQPARIGAGTGRMALSVNRRKKLPDGRVILGHNQSGPADHSVGVVRVDNRAGHPLAALVNYACHPIFLGSASRLISPDFPGPLRRTVERVTGATCLFLQGATGNVNPLNPMHPDTREAERAGALLGLEAAKTFLEIETSATIEREYWLTSVATFQLVRKEPVDSVEPDRVGAREVELSLPLLPLPDAEQARRILEERRTALEKLAQQGADPDDQNPARYQLQWAEMLLRTVEQKTDRVSVNVPVQVLRINDVAVVGVAGELFVEVQLAIKKASPFASTLVAAYSNGCVGYLPGGGCVPRRGIRGGALLQGISPPCRHRTRRRRKCCRDSH